MDHGIYMHGGGGYGGGYIRNYRASSTKNALYAYNPIASIECISVIGFEFVAVINGVNADLANASARFCLDDGHINCKIAGGGLVLIS